MHGRGAIRKSRRRTAEPECGRKACRTGTGKSTGRQHKKAPAMTGEHSRKQREKRPGDRQTLPKTTRKTSRTGADKRSRKQHEKHPRRQQKRFRTRADKHPGQQAAPPKQQTGSPKQQAAPRSSRRRHRATERRPVQRPKKRAQAGGKHRKTSGAATGPALSGYGPNPHRKQKKRAPRKREPASYIAVYAVTWKVRQSPSWHLRLRGRRSLS